MGVSDVPSELLGLAVFWFKESCIWWQFARGAVLVVFSPCVHFFGGEGARVRVLFSNLLQLKSVPRDAGLNGGLLANVLSAHEQKNDIVADRAISFLKSIFLVFILNPPAIFH